MINWSLDRKNLWHPYASIKNPPSTLHVVHSEGTHITLEDHTTLIDGISSWWCTAFGHNANSITEAIRKQSEVLPHVMFAGLTHPAVIEFSSELLPLLPPGLDQIFLADSGSIAVECATKMALQYQYAIGHKSKCRLVALKGGYHGDTTGAMALSDPNGMHKIFHSILPQHFFAEQPKIPFGGQWNDSDFCSMEQIFQQHSDEIAAVIVEPVFQGGNGMWFYHPEYLRKLRALCDQHGALLIFDEIATGFARTGRNFALEYTDVVPDILCLGKVLTGGTITLAVAIASRKVSEVIPCFLHGPTFMANPLACVAGAAALRLFKSHDWASESKRIESALTQELKECADWSNVRDVRVLGAIGVIEVDHLPNSEQISKIILEHGVWLRPFGNWIYTMPPLITSNSEITKIADAMKALARA